MSAAERPARIEELLRTVGLPGHAGKYPSEMSGGMTPDPTLQLRPPRPAGPENAPFHDHHDNAARISCLKR